MLTPEFAILTLSKLFFVTLANRVDSANIQLLQSSPYNHFLKVILQSNCYGESKYLSCFCPEFVIFCPFFIWERKILKAAAILKKALFQIYVEFEWVTLIQLAFC